MGAQSNSASTRRILANHEEVRKLGEGPSGQELARWMINLSDPNWREKQGAAEEDGDEADEYQTLTSLRSPTTIADVRLSEEKSETGDGTNTTSASSPPKEMPIQERPSSNDLSTQRTKQSSAIFSEVTARDKSLPRQESDKSSSSQRNLKKSASTTPKSKPSTVSATPPPIVPLKLEEVAATCEIKESKKLSSLWNNPSGRRQWNDLY